MEGESQIREDCEIVSLRREAHRDRLTRLRCFSQAELDTEDRMPVSMKETTNGAADTSGYC